MQRYWIDTTIAPAIVSKAGPYVLYSDAKAIEEERDFERERANKGWKLHQECHDTMEQHIDRLKAENAKARKEIERLRDALQKIVRYDCECGVPCDCHSWYAMSEIAKAALAGKEKGR